MSRPTVFTAVPGADPEQRPASRHFSTQAAWATCAVLLVAFALRAAGLDSLPPGWRDDEVIETTVHAQIVLDGHYPLYFIQAEGHEPVYHYLTAAWIAAAGRSLLSVRLVSAFFGLLSVACAGRLTRQLFGLRTGLLVACLVAVSFWALMYSRTKIRHISELPFILLGFSALFDMLKARTRRQEALDVARSAGFFALGLYSYLAAAAALLCLAAFGTYLLAAAHLKRTGDWRVRGGRRPAISVFLVLAIATGAYLPLANAIRANATRLGVVGGPLTAARAGDLQPLAGNTARTLAMFGNIGDNEALYNIPGRPVLGIIGFYFFLGGLLISLVRWRDPRHAFLVIWLMCGLAPGFASNPPASLGHVITSLPVTYILTVLPLTQLRIQPSTVSRLRSPAYVARIFLGALLLSSAILREIPDYFSRWPELPAVRFLYKADLHALARQLQGRAAATYVLSGPLSKWDRIAFTLEGLSLETPPRWVNGEWAIVFPAGQAQALFTPAAWQTDRPPQHAASVRFSDDLIFEGWTQLGGDLIAHWQVGPGYSAVEPDIGSSVASPPFSVKAFIHLLDAQGALVAGSDRFDIDPYTLRPGDRFLQKHVLEAPPGRFAIAVGLYDPATGVRYQTSEGGDAFQLGEISIP